MPVNILVAEDSVTMRRVMELTFAGEDAQVTSVSSGEACVEKARETKPDVVFADCSMPGLDGYGVASSIKTTAGLENTAVILVASQKTPYDEAKAQGAGVDDHVLKPFDTQHVIDRVNQVLARPRSKATAPAPTVATAPRVAAPRAPAQAMPAVVPAPRQDISKQDAPTRAPAPQVANVAATSAAATGDMAEKLANLGLNAAQVDGVMALSQEVIEQVVWEVVPELAETIIREEIKRLTAS